MNQNTDLTDLPKLGADERLQKAVIQTRGLLYALAALAARPPDDEIVDDPNKDQAHGLVWLASDLGAELDSVTNEISTEWIAMKRAGMGVKEAAQQKGGAK